MMRQKTREISNSTTTTKRDLRWYEACISRIGTADTAPVPMTDDNALHEQVELLNSTGDRLRLARPVETLRMMAGLRHVVSRKGSIVSAIAFSGWLHREQRHRIDSFCRFNPHVFLALGSRGRKQSLRAKRRVLGDVGFANDPTSVVARSDEAESSPN